jgi:DNA-binding NarL/FixJ family response regulator
MIISIVLADDHTVLREGLKLILENEKDFEVLAATSDGRGAISSCKKYKPKIALLDIGMPNLNGIEAALQIRQISPGTRIIMLSVHGSAEYVSRALEAGAVGYLLKESAGRDVVHAIREVMAGRKYLSRGVAAMVVAGYVNQKTMAAKGALATLSPREREVLQLVAEGKSSKEIARIIHISSKTVDTYRSRLMHKLGLSDLAGLVRFAIEHGVIPPG